MMTSTTYIRGARRVLTNGRELVRSGCPDPQTEAERLVVAAYSRHQAEQERRSVLAEITRRQVDDLVRLLDDDQTAAEA